MKKVFTFIAGFIVGILFVYIWGQIFTPKAEAPTVDILTTEQAQDDNSESQVTDKSTATPITVVDQNAGDVVRIALANMPQRGWLVVHEIKGGVIANALGASLRDKGEQKDIDVYLLRPTVSGGEYAVVLYDDNGDRQFSLATDAVVKDASGNFIMNKFKTN